ncbi:DNA repair protein [Chromatiales bacterium (ex Bugula neritina AB1)]|nr:DNA repair protein [Chromatiales bacterium (ex Bugula neritina AB1)]
MIVRNSRLPRVLFVLAVLATQSCASTYYNAMEKVGYHKRDILVSNVEKTRDAQQEAQIEFKDALEQFSSIVSVENTDLKVSYKKLSAEYEDSQEAAEAVSDRIDSVESVAKALFREWESEIEQFTNNDYKRTSTRQLRDTRNRYDEMLTSMRRSEASMKPVLQTFNDNVLFLKHNLNAQAIGSLKGEFDALQNDIGVLIREMNRSIAESDKFIAELRG